MQHEDWLAAITVTSVSGSRRGIVGTRVAAAAAAGPSGQRRMRRLWEPADETRDVTLQLHSGPFL